MTLSFFFFRNFSVNPCLDVVLVILPQVVWVVELLQGAIDVAVKVVSVASLL